MRARILTATVALLLPAWAFGQTGVSPTADSMAIHELLGQYAKAVDAIDPKLIAEIWSHSARMSRSSIHWARSTASMPLISTSSRM